MWSWERHLTYTLPLPYNNNTLYISFLVPVLIRFENEFWTIAKLKKHALKFHKAERCFFQGDEIFCSLLGSWSAVVFRVRLTGRTHHGTRTVTNLNLTLSPAAKSELQNAVCRPKRKTSTKTWVWQLFPPLQTTAKRSPVKVAYKVYTPAEHRNDIIRCVNSNTVKNPV